VVADVGAGKGEQTFALSREVGSRGRVFSTEIDPGRLRRLREAVVGAKLDKVTVYHHLTDPSGVNASLLRSLRPGGVLAVIDFPPPFFLSRGRFGVPTKIVIGEVTSSGFELLRLIDDWPGRGPLESYCVVFRKAP
jgi:ubiquinone/menaquinone biosynthesis C-methylase UbiE